jgi:hypothetical protein
VFDFRFIIAKSILIDTLPILNDESFLISLLIKFLATGKLVSVRSVVVHGVSTSSSVTEKSFDNFLNL